LRPAPGGPPVLVGQPFVVFLDLPLLRGGEPAHAGTVAAAQSPWPGAVAFYRSPEASNFLLKAMAVAPAVTGVIPPHPPLASTAPARSASRSTKAASPPSPSWRSWPAPTSPR
jgi:hypothetical protein